MAQVISDASFRAVNGKTGIAFVIWFYGSCVHVGSTNGSNVSSSKEDETRAVIFTNRSKVSLSKEDEARVVLFAMKEARYVLEVISWAIQPILWHINELR